MMPSEITDEGLNLAAKYIGDAWRGWTPDAQNAVAQLGTELHAIKADMAMVARLTKAGYGGSVYNGGCGTIDKVQTIAARYREVDPLLIEARELLASMEHPAFGERAREVIDGKHDGEAAVEIALAALKRGIELGKAS